MPVTLAYEDAPPPVDVSNYSTSIVTFVNGRRHELAEASPSTTLLEWLRSIGLTGTKLGCGEGGCGACTVMVSTASPATGELRHAAVNACLMPLCAVDGCAITTVEGIGSPRDGLHPVQQRMVDLHGSQCGFCTPGIVMALYTLFRSKPDLSVSNVEESLDGNLCRCTGYRPIWDAAKSLCSDAERRACSGGCSSKDGGGCCKSSADPAAPVVEFTSDSADKLASASCSTPYVASDAAAKEPDFPSALRKPLGPLRIQGSTPSGKSCWWRPSTLADLLALKAAYPAGRLVAGNTELGIERRFKNATCDVVLCTTAVSELMSCSDTPEALLLGACAPLSEIEHLCEVAAGKRAAHSCDASRAIHDMLRWFASTQIRNVACLGGNLATASPISDMNPLLVACRASLTIASAARGTRQLDVADFFKGYRKVDLQPDEVIVAVRVPHSAPLEFVLPFKQARRREDDISIVTCGLRAKLAPSADASCWVVTDATLAFGGMAATTVVAPRTAASLVGAEWCERSLDAACRTLQEELCVPAAAPGGQPEYRGALAASFLFKWFVAVSLRLADAAADAGVPSPPPPPLVGAAERSAARSFVSEPKPSMGGAQTYPKASYPGAEAEEEPRIAKPTDAMAAKAGGVRVVGESLPHAAGALHVSGVAEYTDDVPLPPTRMGTGLQGWLVRAKRAPATIKSIDPSKALAAQGVFAAYFASDIPAGGHNSIGPIIKDEEVFAEKRVLHVGQTIGIVLADTTEQARMAAELVQVEYEAEAEPTIVTIMDAIEAKSFFDMTNHGLQSGPDVEKVLNQDGLVVVQGEVKMGGQDHFYLECQTTLAIPTDDGLHLIASTQATDKTQKMAARVCGLPANRVVCRVKRMGGGFGGKETRNVFASCAAAVAAHLSGRAVHLPLHRDVDMSTSGGRHPFYAKYMAAATPAGADGTPPKLAALDVQMFSNGGAMLDLSGPVLDRALLHVDNVYVWPSFRARGIVCKTHTPPNTAFRGFGGPQGMMITEEVMDHLAAVTGVDGNALRLANMYPDGYKTPFGQVLEKSEWRVPRAWLELSADAKVAEREAAVEAFNREHKWRKRGMAMLPTKYGINFTAKFMNQGGALVHLYTDGTILVTHGGTEMGQGLHTKVAQVAARAFGVGLSAVHIAETATDKVANSQPTAASASTDLYGMATLDACNQILARLAPIRNGLPVTATLAEVATAAFFARVDLSAHGFFVMDDKRCGFDWAIPPAINSDGTHDNSTRGSPFNYFTQGVGCCEVEIDVLTGDHHVIRADLLVDLGSSINPALDIGQIEGAFTQGMGWSTIEELIWGDGEHAWVQPPGRLFTQGPGTYKPPAFNDCPREFNVRLMSHADNKVCVHSSKAVGEPPFFLGAGVYFAIKKAIAAARKEHLVDGDPVAIRYFPLHSPATSEKIRLACADKFAVRAVTATKGEMCKDESNPEAQAAVANFEARACY